MEALTLTTPMMIEVVGLPGAGKSFFADQFAKTFGAALISYDKIRWTLFAHHTYSKDENQIVDQVARIILDELFRVKHTFIIDGGCNSLAERRELENTARRNGFRILVIDVQTDEATCKRRATKRNSKNEGDRYKQSLTPAQFDAAIKTYNEPEASDNVVVISGKHTYKTQAKMVLRRMIEMSGAKEEAKPTKSSTTPQAKIDLTRHINSPFVG